MGAPFAPGDLVADQPVGGVGIGHAQQRLGQAHQHHALLAGQRIFLREGVDAGAAVAVGADVGDQAPGQDVDRLFLGGRHACARDQPLEDHVLVGEIG